tara:strand:+ start:1235 stop:2200 length:966 start_codon:yes stop_codon:yes gene_type:complete
MVLYTCQRCGYTTNHRSVFRKHLQRKHTCKPKKQDISIEKVAEINQIYIQDLHTQYTHKSNTKIIQKLYESTHTKVTQNTHKMPVFVPKIEYEINPKKDTKKTRLKCIYCYKTFTTKNSRYRHQKHFCKNRLSLVNSADTSNYAMIHKLNELENKLGNIQIQNAANIQNAKNIQNQTIVINNYGSENLSHITKGCVTNLLLKGPYSSIPRLMNMIHFDKKHPENHTVAITNKKSKYGSIRKNDSWQVMLIKDLLDDILINKFEFIDELFPKIEEELPDHKKTCYKEFSDKIMCDEEVRKKLEKDLYLVILNSTKGLGLKTK